MIRMKDGVEPRSFWILAAVSDVSDYMTVPIIITSGTDGKHMTGSKHYTGEAVDIRSRNMTPLQRDYFVKALQERLGLDYQVIVEKDHIHCEYDPK